ncbi:MAG: DUF3560 domain-containing protein [Treponema sp.]|jgi:tetratricopeptide (TPR) repeat protein|nr:DUF3560 domain-containing protein [Treponema sp.]
MAIGREDYQERKADRISRYEERAEKAGRESAAQRKRAQSIEHAIPLGQPILVGHHSEGRHRADLKKADTAFQKAYDADKKAGYYQGKAETAGNNRAISGDNPEAVHLYQEKLAKLETDQEHMKAVNKAFAKGEEALKALGLDDAEIALIKKAVESAPSFAKKPYPSWALSNNNAEIRRIKEKLEQLSRLDSMDEETIAFNGGELVFNAEINRVQFLFDDIPGEEIRTILKRNGYNWSRSEGAWQRQRTLNGIGNAKWILPKIKELMEAAQ